MKQILTQFLEAIEVRHTHRYSDRLYYEHPFRNSLYGLKKMLDVYGVKTIGVRSSDNDPRSLTFPCILHLRGTFVLGLACDMQTVAIKFQGKKESIPLEEFKRIWTGNALVVSETTDAEEPDYEKNRREENMALVREASVPMLLFGAFVGGVCINASLMSISKLLCMALGLVGLYVCWNLVQKQVSGNSHFAHRVCGLFRRSDCDSVLDGRYACLGGIGWSEIGFGYFLAYTLVLALCPTSGATVTVISCVAMCYGIWSIAYQWLFARTWCLLCVFVQILVWLMGIVTLWHQYQCQEKFSLLSCLGILWTFGFCIMMVHIYAEGKRLDRERRHVIYRYHALKCDAHVLASMLAKSSHYTVTTHDSSILFGNTKARIRVSILVNPHCNPCARIHDAVAKVLKLCGDSICFQYILYSFAERLDDSVRYLISCYDEEHLDESFDAFSNWFRGERTAFNAFVSQQSAVTRSDIVEAEFQRHKAWRNRTGIMTTPTMLVNGYLLPDDYTLRDICMLVDVLGDVMASDVRSDIHKQCFAPT